ncbi:retinoschisin-like [Diadema antillarum]
MFPADTFVDELVRELVVEGETYNKEYVQKLVDKILELLRVRQELIDLILNNHMGMESGNITADQLSASSCYQYTDCADRGRLNHGAGNGRRGAWCAASNDASPWIQVDFGRKHVVSGVITQGRADIYRQWVKTYRVQYKSDSDDIFLDVEDGKGHAKTFQGNTDMNTEVTNKFPKPVTACAVRILPLTWNSHVSMRFELLGDG